MTLAKDNKRGGSQSLRGTFRIIGKGGLSLVRGLKGFKEKT